MSISILSPISISIFTDCNVNYNNNLLSHKCQADCYSNEIQMIRQIHEMLYYNISPFYETLKLCTSYFNYDAENVYFVHQRIT